MVKVGAAPAPSVTAPPVSGGDARRLSHQRHVDAAQRCERASIAWRDLHRRARWLRTATGQTIPTGDSPPALMEELVAAQAQVANLQIALRTCRIIGIAVGIVMAEYKLTAEDAFEVLVRASQRRYRKLRDLAEQIVHTGRVPRP